jgi:glycosyltransferase involved in cell wall biosynthesis
MGQTTPLVSIVVPTYNRADLLPQALDSCLGQTCRDLEVVVVNDGSRDNTEEVLRQYAGRDTRVRFFSKKNEGIADTLNYGHDRARGKYVGWTSDDNLYYPEAIGVMVDYLEGHPDVGLVYADARMIDAGDKVLRIIHAPEPDVMAKKEFLQAAGLYRREVYSTVGGFRRRWVRCQDFDFYIRAHKQFKAAHIPKVLYDYRWHEMSMSGNHEAHMLENAALLASHADCRQERRNVWAGHLGCLGRYCEHRGWFWKSAGYYARAVLYAPRHLRDVNRSLKCALYFSLPERFKVVWRFAKRRGTPPLSLF